MAYSQRRGRYDYSLSPPPRYRSRSRSRSPPRYDDSPSPPPRYRSCTRSRSPPSHHSNDVDAHNPGNNLYITGLSTRVTERDLEEHCSSEGKVLECHLVVDPRTKESRGFAFVTMDSMESAERCIKYLNKSILEGRVITVEKAKRKRARTPTPGKYLGVRTTRRTTSSYDYDRRRGYSDGRRSPRYSPYCSRDYSPEYSPYRGKSRYKEYSPYRRDSRYKERSLSPRYSPYGSPRKYDGSPRRRSSHRSSYRSRSRSRSVSPYYYR